MSCRESRRGSAFLHAARDIPQGLDPYIVRIEDRIDPTVGFLSEVKIGSEVRSGDSIGLLYCSDQDRAQRAAARIQAAYVVEDGRPSKLPELIKEVIDK